jgi:hypothetical protein
MADLETLSHRVDALDAKLAELTAKTDAQTIMIEKIERAVSGVLGSPVVRNALIAVCTTVWVVLTGWLASRGQISK